jgi:glycogen(starch) synthase
MTSVLMTADAVGGVWTYSLDLINASAPLGVRYTLVVLGPGPSDEQWREVERSAVEDVIVRPFALEWMDEPWAEVDRAGELLLELESERHPDVVHLNGYAHAVLPWRAPTVAVAHSDVESWWRAVHGAAAPQEWAEYRMRVQRGLDAAHAVVAPTAAVLDDLRHSYAYDGGCVIPNGRDAGWVTPCPKEPIVLAAGRVWDDAKNLRSLQKVAAELEWPVVIAGDNAGSSDAASWLTGEVRFLGTLPFAELAEWLNRAAVFVAPARYEPFGLGALEAGLAGCALVLGDIPSLREVWGDAATFVDPTDSSSIGDAIASLIGDPARLADLGDACRARARCYSAERMAARYAQLYSELTEAPL